LTAGAVVITRRDSLEQALKEIQTHALDGASVIVVSRRWWDELSERERDGFRLRAEGIGVHLHADDRMSGHFVEVRGDDAGSSLSTEHPT
jgi:hypothetical protein